MLTAGFVQGRGIHPDTVLLSLTVTNQTNKQLVFVDYAPFYSYEVRRSDGAAVRPVEGDIAIAGGATPVTIMPGSSIERVINLACIGRTMEPEYRRANSNHCYLSFDLSARGTYQVVVSYRAPQPPLGSETHDFLELRSNAVSVEN